LTLFSFVVSKTINSCNKLSVGTQYAILNVKWLFRRKRYLMLAIHSRVSHWKWGM